MQWFLFCESDSQAALITVWVLTGEENMGGLNIEEDLVFYNIFPQKTIKEYI